MILEWALLGTVAAMTWALLRGGWLPPGGAQPIHAGGSGILLAILSVVVHEYGHVAAFRVAGHSDARFRLIPLVGGVAISARPPATPAHDLFITIMGPGICLIAMAAAWRLALGMPTTSAGAGLFLVQFASITGALNLFNLLPIYPLDGGRIAALTLGRFAPEGVRRALMGISLLIVAYSVLSFSFLILLFALISFKAAKDLNPHAMARRPLDVGMAINGLFAWAAMSGAFALGGWAIFRGFLPG